MTLDPSLARDTLALIDLPDARVLLARDSRWPWLILLPSRDEVSEIHELAAVERDAFLRVVSRTSELMQEITGCRSVNVAMLGNVVAQLHCHVVARSPGDPGWPGPIWGFGESRPRATAAIPDFAASIARTLLEERR